MSCLESNHLCGQIFFIFLSHPRQLIRHCDVVFSISVLFLGSPQFVSQLEDCLN
jgi:hypothetical protein